MGNLPGWLKKSIPKSRNIKEIRNILGRDSIHTVCEGALCPNIGECFSNKTVTFMILGDSCTRNCRFCAVKKEKVSLPDPDEPLNVALSAKKLGLKYVVVTSVTRDDLPDGGAKQFADTIYSINSAIPGAKVEVLIPDLKGDMSSLKIIIDAKPNIINHNLETVKRLYSSIRPQAIYERSLKLLKNTKIIDNTLYTKSGIMVGLGEKKDEVIDLMRDLRTIDCDILTIGQYLQPSKDQIEVSEFVPPEIFSEYEEIGLELGFKKVFSGPFVRSSYKASEIYV